MEGCARAREGGRKRAGKEMREGKNARGRRRARKEIREEGDARGRRRAKEEAKILRDRLPDRLAKVVFSCNLNFVTSLYCLASYFSPTLATYATPG